MFNYGSAAGNIASTFVIINRQVLKDNTEKVDSVEQILLSRGTVYLYLIITIN